MVTRFSSAGSLSSAVLWPHGLDSDPRVKDDRTHHEAMPVTKGVKWAANYWIHGRDFKTSMATGCDGRQGQPKRSRMMKKSGEAERRVLLEVDLADLAEVAVLGDDLDTSK